MRRPLLICVALLAAMGFAAQGRAQATPDLIAQGKYLAAAADCAACHTARGGPPFAGGGVIHSAFGTLVGPNLTADQKTGIGAWTDEQFVNAVKYGVGRQGEHLYPGMPYPAFNAMPRADILKIRAYLASLPPVHHAAPASKVRFPYTIRALLGLWNLLYFPDTGDFRPDPDRSAAWNRGAYLVRNLGNCSTCHTAKNLFGAAKPGVFLQGSVVAGWNAPSLVDDRTGLSNWTADDIAAYLKTGHNAYADAAGLMAGVILRSTSHLTDADREAIGIYLKSLPGPTPGSPRAPIAAGEPAMRLGAEVYGKDCAACHMATGTGQAGMIPALAASPVVQALPPLTLLRVVLHGAPPMPAFANRLDDGEIAAVLTYIRNSWGNAAPAVSLGMVSTARSQAGHP